MISKMFTPNEPMPRSSGSDLHLKLSIQQNFSLLFADLITSVTYKTAPVQHLLKAAFLTGL